MNYKDLLAEMNHAEAITENFENAAAKAGIKITAPITYVADLDRAAELDKTQVGGKTSNRIYTSDGKYMIEFWNSSMKITDTSNAMKTGKSAKEWIVRHDRSNGRFIHYLTGDLEVSQMKLTDFLDAVENKTLGEKFASIENLEHLEGTTANTIKSKDIFSPYGIKNLKRVKDLKDKVTLPTLAKLIANGQYDALGLDYSYTDDYAFDNANNFGKGKLVNAMEILQEIIESGMGHKPYFTSPTKDGRRVITFGPHSNKSYSLVLNLKNKHRI